MINAVSLLNEIRQPEFILPDAEINGDGAAFSSMLEDAVRKGGDRADSTEQASQTADKDVRTENDGECKMTDMSDEISIEDTEIELTAESSTPNQTMHNMIAAFMKHDMPGHEKPSVKDSKYTAAIAGLNTFVKKNMEITDGKKSASSLLDAPLKPLRIKVRDLDTESRTKIAAVLNKVRSGHLSESAGMQSVAAIAAQSPAVIGMGMIKPGKNVKVSAKIAAATVRNESKINLFIPQTRMSQPAKTEKISITKTETIQNKTAKTEHTEADRRYEKNRKAKASDHQGNIILNDRQPNVGKLTTELTLQTDHIHEADNAKADVKTVLSENKDAVFNKMAENTRIIQDQNMTKFSMVMRPENVGRMDFHLTMKDGKLNGRIILQNSEAADFFRANIEEITAVFRKANVELGQLDVSLAGQQFHSEAQTFAGQSHGGGQTYSKETLETVRAVSQLTTDRAVSAYESYATPAAGSTVGNNRINLLI